jgi:hypothetical protein
VDYRIDPAPVGRRSSRSVVAIAGLVSVALIAGVVALTISGRSGPPVAVATVSAAPLLPASLAAASSSGPSAVADASLPLASAAAPQVQCHDVPHDRCGRIATAVLGVVADPTLGPATTIDIWGSLLCNDSFDCPPARSEGRLPAGSAVVALASSMVLWVNVMQRVADYDRGSTDPELDAWIIPSRPTS